MKTDEKMKAYPETSDVLLSDIGEDDDTVQVYRDAKGMYQVVRNGYLRHPDCNAESAMSALAHYLNSALYALAKLKNPG